MLVKNWIWREKLGSLTSKIKCTIDSRKTGYEWRNSAANSNREFRIEEKMMRLEFAITKIGNPLYSSDLVAVIFRYFQNWKMCLNSSHQAIPDYIIERYSGKRAPRMFPAMSQSPHDVLHKWSTLKVTTANSNQVSKLYYRAISEIIPC